METLGPMAEPAGSVVLRPYVAADQQSVLDLLQASLGWVPNDLYASFFRWKHVDNPFGPSAGWVLTLLTAGGYLALLAYSARFPDLPVDDPRAPIIRLPELWPTVRAGLHFLVPLVVLLWCLMVEELSPGLSAFWATATVMATVIVQPLLLVLFRRQGELRAACGRGRDSGPPRQLLDARAPD